jgi:hypothetical protein
MLHVDEGENGVYEFPGADVPVIIDGEVVMAPFTATAATATATAEPLAGGESCASLADADNIREALANCLVINENSVCYGSPDADVSPVEFRFQQLRDRRPLEALTGITITGGVVVLNLAIPGAQSPVTAIAFNDPDTVEGRIMRVDTINNELVCQELPPGLVVRSESGASGSISINGVEIVFE